MKLARKIIGTSSLIFSFFLLFSGMMGHILISSEPDNIAMINEIQEVFEMDAGSRQQRIDEASYDDEVSFATGSEMAEARKHYDTTVANKGIGFIYMPKSNISVPILAGTSDWNLFNGVGTNSPDQELGEGLYVGLSHNLINETLLQRIDQMSEGDMIYATDFEDVYIYQTLRQEVVHETDGEFFDEPGDGELGKMLLYRCEGGYGTDWRRSLYAEFVEKKPISEVEGSILDGLQVNQELRTSSLGVVVEAAELTEEETEEETEEVTDEVTKKRPSDNQLSTRMRSALSPVRRVLSKVMSRLARLINKSDFARNYFLGTYRFVDDHTLTFGAFVIVLFLSYGIL